MARYNAAGVNSGEIARVLRKLADAFSTDNRTSEAAICHEEAETIRRELQKVMLVKLPDKESSYDLHLAAQFRT
ncbi:hypothetical protein WAI453_012589 [Rhynchosporium graminicola]